MSDEAGTKNAATIASQQRLSIMSHRCRCYQLLAILLMGIAPNRAKASFCASEIMGRTEIQYPPLLAVGRILSVEMQSGRHFTGDPKQSAAIQPMTAEIEVLRFNRGVVAAESSIPERIRIHYLGRDGPDFSFCPVELPAFEPGQVVLIPLQPNPKGWLEGATLFKAEGHDLILRMSSAMEKPMLEATDSRTFLTRELVNSLECNEPIALFTAAEFIARHGSSLEPELSAELQRLTGKEKARWAQILANMLLTFPDGPINISDVKAGKTERNRPQFEGLPLIELALKNLPHTADTELLVWHALINDLSGFADEPYTPLFSYKGSTPLSGAVAYLSEYRNDPDVVSAVRSGLRDDRPGFSYLAESLIYYGQKACLPEALERAMKVVNRPTANAGDLTSSVQLLRQYASDTQRRELAAVISQYETSNPDYAKYLKTQLIR